jgi:hypothetical protein
MKEKGRMGREGKEREDFIYDVFEIKS